MSDIALSEPETAADAPLPRGAACEACGSPVEPHDRFCPACGNPSASGEPDAEATIQEQQPPQKFFACKNCGAEVATDPDQRSYTCAFCDSTYVVEFTPEATERQRPEFVIGFGVTRDKAAEKFDSWLRENSWFRPGDLASARIAEKLRGVYLPFWSFSTLAESRWSASIGEYWWKTETYTTTVNGKTVTKTRRVRHTEWWNLSGEHHRYYSGYLVSGSRGLAQQDADRIKPFQLPALKRYRPYFLAGWLAEEYSIERDEALQTCRREFHRREQQNVADFLPGDTHSDLRVSTNFSQTNSDLILLPVYLLAYQYKDKLYRFMINGQTGKVAGDKPLSWVRIGIAIGAGLALVGLLVLLFWLMR